tara:strand:+ start:2790 stop:3077 length:288 start_codon:yes stop_codon:yes gene_type:complete
MAERLCLFGPADGKRIDVFEQAFVEVTLRGPTPMSYANASPVDFVTATYRRRTLKVPGSGYFTVYVYAPHYDEMTEGRILERLIERYSGGGSDGA